MDSALDSPLGRFILLCLASRWDPFALEQVKAALQASAVDLDAAAALAGRLRLAPLVYHATRALGFPASRAQDSLRGAYYAAAARAALLHRRWEELLGSLEGAGFPVLVLKGGALAESVYGSAALRPMTDLDLLVREVDLEKAGDARNDAWRIRIRMRSNARPQAKLRYLRETLFPPPSYMVRRYCPDHPGLWPLAYLKRAQIGLFQLLGYIKSPF